MLCKNCRKFFYKRTDFLLHINQCTSNNSLLPSSRESEHEESMSPADDTDADPDWHPELNDEETQKNSTFCFSFIEKKENCVRRLFEQSKRARPPSEDRSLSSPKKCKINNDETQKNSSFCFSLNEKKENCVERLPVLEQSKRARSPSEDRSLSSPKKCKINNDETQKNSSFCFSLNEKKENCVERLPVLEQSKRARSPSEDRSLSSPKKCKINNDVVTCLKSRLMEYERQWGLARESGCKSTMRRKAKHIALYKKLIKKNEEGEIINLKKQPDPFSSPLSTKKANESSHSPSQTLVSTNDIKETINAASVLPTPLTNITNIIKRKENFCITCKKMVKEFCKHYENVHQDTNEGKKLKLLNNIVDKNLRKKMKMKITEVLRKKGNAEFSRQQASESFNHGQDAIVIPVKRFAKGAANQASAVQCSHCLGYYNRRKFCRHLRICQVYLESKSTSILEGNVNALSEHSLSVINSSEGASEELTNEILKGMKPRKAKDVAIRDQLIMKYASEFYKTRRASFQKVYVSRVIIDLAKVVMRMQEKKQEIKCLEDCLTPEHFSLLVNCILTEAGYDEDSGNVNTCGLGNRLRSHIKGAAETAKKEASEREYKEQSPAQAARRKRLKHFLILMEEKWANEVGRIFDAAVKKSRSEKDPKLAAEDDIVKTCQYITSNYRTTITKLDNEAPGSVSKQKLYNQLMDLLVTHIMCLIRRRPVDFKRANNIHYERMEQQEDLISEIKNSPSMKLSQEDLEMCNKFKIFYVPGKGWKEMVPIALTNVMREALDTIQRNKPHVGVCCDTLFVRAGGKPIDPRVSMRNVTKHVVLKKPLHMSGNGLRHHAGTFSKLHSTHPQYQDYLASALGHTLHIHRLHYEMPTSITQKLIVCPVLHKMTINEKEENNKEMCDSREIITNNASYQTREESVENPDSPKTPDNNSPENPDSPKTPLKEWSEDSSPIQLRRQRWIDEEKSPIQIKRQRWTDEEKNAIYGEFGRNILDCCFPSRNLIVDFYKKNISIFKNHSIQALVTFIHNKCSRKQKNVTPEVKKFMSSHRKITNVPI